MSADALFALDLNCTNCGRHMADNVCPWCIAKEPKAAGMKAANVDPEWQHRAIEYRRNLGLGAIFTADDLIDAVGLPTGSSNQIGAVLNGWAKRGWIVPADYTTSTRKSNHGRVLRSWRVAI